TELIAYGVYRYMLKIRPEHMAVFHEAAEASFLRRVVQYLRERHSSVAVQLPSGITTVELIPEETLFELVENGIKRARRDGMSWESALSAFVVLMFVTAPNFDDHPLIRRVMKDDKIDANARIDHLWESTTEQNWEAVKQRYDTAAWRLKA